MGRVSWVASLKEVDPLKYIQFCETQRENGLKNREAASARRRGVWDAKPWEELGKDGKRRRVIEEQGRKCNSCHLSHWRDQPLSLELEHKDGDHMNDERDNLEALCPNCHSLTPTWRGRNKNLQGMVANTELAEALNKTTSVRQALILVGLSPRGGNYVRAKKIKQMLCSEEPIVDISPPKSKIKKEKELNFCLCGKFIGTRAMQCRDCYTHQQATKIQWPLIEELLQMVSMGGYQATGKALGVSGNAVKKHIKNLSTARNG